MPARTTYTDVFAVGQFRLLFAGQLAYVTGFGFELLGLSVLVYARSRSPLLAAVAFSAGFAPQVAGGLLFTSLADRLPPRAVITTGLLVRAAPGLIIGMLPGMPIAVMIAIVALAAATSPVYNAAISRLVPDILTGDSYVLGRAVLGLTASGAQILSLGVGGALLAVLSPRRLILVAGLTLALSALIRLGLSAPVRGTGTRAGMRGTIRATFAGNGRLLRDPRIRGLLLIQWLPAWLGTSAESLIVPYAGSLANPRAAAPMLASVPVGMLLGDALAGRFCLPATRERLVLPLVLLIGAPLPLLLARPAVPVACAVLLVSGLGYAYGLGLQRAFLESVPADMRGQAFGLAATGLMGGQGLCPAAAGAVAAAAGPAATMAAAGVAVVVAAMCLRGPIITTVALPALL